MTQTNVIGNERSTGSQEETQHNHPVQTHLNRILERLSPLDIPAQEYLEAYLRHKVRLHHKSQTMSSSSTSIVLFLDFYGKSGKRDL
jgi:hypothetical protein